MEFYCLGFICSIVDIHQSSLFLFQVPCSFRYRHYHTRRLGGMACWECEMTLPFVQSLPRTACHCICANDSLFYLCIHKLLRGFVSSHAAKEMERKYLEGFCNLNAITGLPVLSRPLTSTRYACKEKMITYPLSTRKENANVIVPMLCR